MAKITGAFTGWKGKVGNMVFSMWKGIQVAKNKAFPANPQSEGQTTQRTKLSNLIAAGKVLVSTLIRGFWDPFATSYQSGWGNWLKYNLLSQTTSTLTPSEMIMSRGSLLATAIDSAEYDTATGIITVAYSATPLGNQADTDPALLVIYDEANDKFLFSEAAEAREDAACIATIDTGLTPANVHVWLFFSQDEDSELSMVSDSAYSACSAPA